MTSYPTHFESDVVLRTGRTLRIRPVRPEDREQMVRFFARLSPESMHYRFFGMPSPEMAADCTPVNVDYDRIFGAVGEVGGDIAGVAHYFARGTKAEVAFTICDAAQGTGLGTKLLETLVVAAREHGIERF